MKKIILIFTAVMTIAFCGCGTGVYSVSSGNADQAAVCFVDAKRYDISVNIDGTTYAIKTIKQKPHKARRNIKQTAKEQIIIAPGSHNVKVVCEGQTVYNHTVFVSATEVKIIEL